MKQVLSLLIVLVGLGTQVARGEVLVVVHKNNPLTTISEQDLKEIYLGKTRKFPNGKPSEPLNLEYDGTREQFEEKVLNKNKAALGRYWSKRVFTGKGKPPKEVGDDDMMIEAISNDTSSIGYVKGGTKTNGVKVIKRIK